MCLQIEESNYTLDYNIEHKDRVSTTNLQSIAVVRAKLLSKLYEFEKECMNLIAIVRIDKATPGES